VPRLSKNRVLLFVKLLHRNVANAWCRFGITPLRTAGQGGEFAARQNKDGNGNGNGLLFHMTQPISRSTIKAIACSKPTISEH